MRLKTKQTNKAKIKMRKKNLKISRTTRYVHVVVLNDKEAARVFWHDIQTVGKYKVVDYPMAFSANDFDYRMPLLCYLFYCYFFWDSITYVCVCRFHLQHPILSGLDNVIEWSFVENVNNFMVGKSKQNSFFDGMRLKWNTLYLK